MFRFLDFRRKQQGDAKKSKGKQVTVCVTYLRLPANKLFECRERATTIPNRWPYENESSK